MLPKVSVILPCYGVEKYLGRCMNALLNQTLRDIEIIMVDDVSPDRVPMMCEEYASKDSRVKVVHKKKNEGLGFARNTGLAFATGEYVAFFDSDDFVDESMLQNMYAYAKQNELEACFCGYKIYKDPDHVRIRSEKDDYEICDGRMAVDGVLMDMVGADPSFHSDVRILSSMWKGIYSLNVIKQNRLQFVSERDLIAEDIIFHINFLPCVSKIGFVPECYYNYCDNETSLTRSYKAERFQREVLQYETMRGLLLEKGYDEGVFLNRIDRYLLLKIRACITQQYKYIKINGLRRMRNETKKILNSVLVRELVKRYPYRRLKIKHKAFFLLVKWRLVDAIFFMFYVNRV